MDSEEFDIATLTSDEPSLVILKPSVENGCIKKVNHGEHFKKSADKLSRKYGISYGVYRCPHCGGTHLTSKFNKLNKYYEPFIHVSHP